MLHELDNRLIYERGELPFVMKILIKCPQYPHYSAHILDQDIIACYHYLLLSNWLLYQRLLYNRVILLDWQYGGLKLLC
jgi:hypothetical protein